MPINSVGTGCATYGFIEAIEWMRFDTRDDYLKYQSRVKAIADQMDDYIAALREGIRRGYISSVDVCRNFETQLNNLINSELEEFYLPLKNDNYKTVFTTEEQVIYSLTH